jgi:hypothetical protein
MDRDAGRMGYLNDLGASFRNNGAEVFSSGRCEFVDFELLSHADSHARLRCTAQAIPNPLSLGSLHPISIPR